MGTANISIDFATKSDINSAVQYKSINPSILKTALTNSNLAFGYGLGDVYANAASSNTSKMPLLSTLNVNATNINTSKIITATSNSNVLSAQGLRTSSVNSIWLKYGRYTSAYENCSAGALSNYHRDLNLTSFYNAYIGLGYNITERLGFQVAYAASSRADYLKIATMSFYSSVGCPQYGYATIYESASNLGSLGSSPPVGATRISQSQLSLSSASGDSNPCVDGRMVSQSFPYVIYYPIPAIKRGMTRYYGIYATTVGSSCGWGNTYAPNMDISEVVYTDVAQM